MNAHHESSLTELATSVCETGRHSDPQFAGRRAVLGALVAWPLRSGAARSADTVGALAAAAATGIAAGALPGSAIASSANPPAASYEEAILRFTGGTRPTPGKVKLDVAVLIDNGNTVPVSVSVDHSMTERDHVRAIALFSERNPQHEVLRVELMPDSGRAAVSTRIRLATSQRLMAVAGLSDGSFWSHEMDVIVTLAACIEGTP
jgi:sulfur-oxidizing protein SoxY